MAVIDRVKAIIVEQFGVPEDEVTAEARLADLGADALDSTEVLMACEEEFGLEISDAAAPRLTTVQDIATYILQHAGDK